MKKIDFLALVVMASVLTACGPSMKAQRMTTAQGDEMANEITDGWLATDTTNAVNSIIKQMLQHKGYQQYLKTFQGRKPKLFVAEIQNNTADAYFPIQDLNDELLNELSAGGEVVLIDEAARNRILKEIRYQNDGMVNAKDVKSIGKAAGADMIIFGNVNMKPEMFAGKTLKEYSVNLRVTDIESGVEKMRGRYKVSKYSERSGYRW
ncbi:MAG: hypothetical protein IJ590_01610 [Rickettsiales bacterium]|nr:hypothetical protein [Rickettsiales bacterium]